jgi:hypothetical protein
MAKSAKAGFMQIQFGVTGVLFDDGTAWPSQAALILRNDFDAFKKPSPGPSPAEAAALSELTHSERSIHR